MLKKLVERVKSPNRQYVLARGSAAAFALVFALIYSKDLGVTNRSIVTFAMATSVLITILITSGTTLTFRLNYPKDRNQDAIPTIVFLILVEALFAATALAVALLFLSNFKVEIPKALFIVLVFYGFFSTSHFALTDCMIAIGKLGFAAKIEIATIFIQFCVYLFFHLTHLASFAVSVLLAFIISYFLCSLACLIALKIESTPQFAVTKSGIAQMLKSTRGNHGYALANALVDKSDRLVIGWLLPIDVLGRYAVFSSLISSGRFVPDALNKIVIHDRHFDLQRFRNSNRALQLFVVFLSVTILSSFSYWFIKHFLGNQWLLPFTIPLLLCVQEMTRGYFQFSSSKQMTQGRSLEVSRQNQFMGVTAIPLLILGIQYFGIMGSPLALITNYTLHAVVLKRRYK